jgi:chloride channel protein, CIC family
MAHDTSSSYELGQAASSTSTLAEPIKDTSAARRHDRRAGSGHDHHIGLRAQFLRAGVTGLLAGAVAVVFNLAVRLGEGQRESLLRWAHQLPLGGFLIWPVLAALLAVFAVWITQRFAPEAAGSGIPHIKGVLQHSMQLRWRRVLPVKLIGGIAALVSGLSLGREGPTVQMGAATAQLAARLLKLPRGSHTQLIAAGAGAGLAAAFNAPLAGFVFVIEELRRELSPLTSSIALIAAITADVVMRSVLGQQPSFIVHGTPTPPLAALPLFLLIGVFAAFIAQAFNKSLLAALVFAKALPFKIRLLSTGVLAASIGLAAWWWPAVSGGGYANAQEFLSGRLANPGLIPWLLFVLGLRLALTVLSYATGAPGGVFAPMLAMGASLGLACGLAVAGLWPGVTSLPVAFAVVAMAALFAAVVRAPLTGIVLILEMTANYSLLLPLMVAAMTAFLIAERIKLKPIYESLLELSQADAPATHGTTIWLDVVVEADSALDGTTISDLGWPESCRIVTLQRSGNELATRSSMELRAGDHLHIVLDTTEQAFASKIVAAARVAQSQDAG